MKQEITVDAEELQEKLGLILDDNYASIKLTIESDTYEQELRVDAVGLSEDDTVEYGNISAI